MPFKTFLKIVAADEADEPRDESWNKSWNKSWSESRDEPWCESWSESWSESCSEYWNRPWPQPRRAGDEAGGQTPKAPQCPQCGIVMRWYQSKLERNGSESIVHSFYCTNCAQVANVREPKASEARASSAEPMVA